jgi:hypothetical protein
MFAELLSVAPAFAKVTEYLAKTTETAGESAATIKARANLEIDLLEAQGRSAEALAAKRALELAAMDAALRPLQEQVWATQDAAKAQAELNAQTEAAAAREQSLALQVMAQRAEVLELTGKAEQALATRRYIELQQMDESLRPLKLRIYAMQDEKVATDAAAQAAQDAAAAAKAIADERTGLETRLLELQGDTVALRERELAALDPSNRDLQARIYALEDEATANEAATKAAQDAAAEIKRIADERAGLETRLLQLQGDTAALRERELAALDPSNRELQTHIYALEDLATAMQNTAKAVQDAAAEATRIANERAGLERQLLTLQGDTTALRALELAALDPSNRALQERIYRLQDEKVANDAAAKAAEDAAKAAEAERKRIDDLALEAANKAKAVADQRYGLETRLLELQGDTVALRARELTLLDPSNQDLQNRIWLMEDEKVALDAATKAAEDLAATQKQAADEAAAQAQAATDEITGLNRQLLDAQGNVAAIRALDLAGLLSDDARAIQGQIWAIQDAKVAEDELAAAQEKAAQVAADAAAELQRIADQRYGIETRLLELQGDTNKLRERELALLDPSNRALQAQVWALEDAAAAADAAAEAQAEANRIAEEAAANAQRIAEESAQAAQRITDERYGLETKLLEAQGATNELRARELALIDPTNRALQEQIWALEDARVAADASAKAAQEAADAQAALAKQQEDAAKAAAEAAEQLRKAGVSLNIRYFEALGDTVAATALKRQEELAATDESLRALLRQIYALEDAKVAEEEYTKAVTAKNTAVEAARNALSSAYEREAGALQSTIDKFRDFGDALREFRAGLFTSDTVTSASYRQLQVAFLKTSALAATGDTTALGGLAGAGRSFLDASRAQASTLAQYQRDVAMVAQSVDTAIGAADDAVDYAQAQLDALERLVGGYIDLNDNVLTVAQAIQQLREAQAQEVVPATVSPIVDAQEVQTQAIKDSNARLEQRIAELEGTLSRLLGTVADKLNNIDRREQKYDRGDYKAIGNDTDTPVYTSAAP